MMGIGSVVRVSIECRAVTQNIKQECIACRGHIGWQYDKPGKQGKPSPCGWCNGTGYVDRPDRSVLDHIILVDRP